jgi:hypothetical protein
LREGEQILEKNRFPNEEMAMDLVRLIFYLYRKVGKRGKEGDDMTLPSKQLASLQSKKGYLDL